MGLLCGKLGRLLGNDRLLQSAQQLSSFSKRQARFSTCSLPRSKAPNFLNDVKDGAHPDDRTTDGDGHPDFSAPPRGYSLHAPINDKQSQVEASL